MSVQHYGRKADVQLLDDIVGALIRRYNITEAGGGGRVHDNGTWDILLRKTAQLSPTTLGRIIAAMPDASLYSIHCCTWLGKYESGPYLLQQIAASVMASRINELLNGGDWRTCHQPHETGADIIGSA